MFSTDAIFSSVFLIHSGVSPWLWSLKTQRAIIYVTLTPQWTAVRAAKVRVRSSTEARTLGTYKVSVEMLGQLSSLFRG